MDWVLAGMVLISTWMIGRKNKWGWVVGLMASAGWAVYTFQIQEYALATNAIFMSAIRIRSGVQWFRES